MCDVYKLFSKKSSRKIQGLNNMKIDYIIFSNDSIKGNNKMNEILDNVKERVKSICYHNQQELRKITLIDGTEYEWIKPHLDSGTKGYRCKNCFIDKNLSFEDFYGSAMPIITQYCGEDTVEMF